MKRSYHTDLIVQYQLGILPETIYKQIPSSTLSNWKKKNVSNFFGMENAKDYQAHFHLMKEFLSKKALLNAAKGLYFIYSAYIKLFDLVKDKKKIYRLSKTLIINTIIQVTPYIGQLRAFRAFGISYQQFYHWKKQNTCKLTPVTFCRKKYYNQLTFKEIDTIKAYLSNPLYRNWNITSVFYKILKDKAAFFSLTSFYKYVNQLNLKRSRPEKRKYPRGVRADAPKKILHMDVTIYRPLDNTRVYLYFLVDNFSRYILNWKVSLKYSAQVAFENIKEAYETYELEKVPTIVDLITDGGVENKGAVEEYMNNSEINMQKIIAQIDILFSNSMAEAVNKRIKYDFLFTTKLLDFQGTCAYLPWAVEQYNNKPHSSLYGLTPQEVFQGIVPDKNMYKEAIRQSGQKRKLINQQQNCLNCIDIATI